MDAYLNQRISGRFEYLEPYVDEVPYFDNPIVNIREIECLVDCGAFIGDTYQSFLDQFAQNGIDFMGHAFLWEPNDDNLHELRNNVSGDDRVTVIPKGAGKEKSRLCFDGNGQDGHISDCGIKKIDIDTIDSIVGSTKVDMIKMDIEGAEADAILGAKDTILRDKPILAICVYHKRDDLITIPKLILQICDEYKFYLRAYSKHATEIVLYAVI